MLALTALLGILVMVSAGSLLTLYLGVELLSLSLYASSHSTATPASPRKRR